MDSPQLPQQVVDMLEKLQANLVLAESCTAGLIAASLGGVPGVSRYLSGSMVVYREQAKIDWLGVDPMVIEEFTAVSEATTRAIARGVLEKTDEANVSLGITGHLGPGSPEKLDGQIFVACCRTIDSDVIEDLGCKQHQLKTESRAERQREAVSIALTQLQQTLCNWP